MAESDPHRSHAVHKQAYADTIGNISDDIVHVKKAIPVTVIALHKQTYVHIQYVV